METIPPSCCASEPSAAKRQRLEHWSISARLLSGQLVADLVLPDGAATTVGHLLDEVRRAAALDGRVKLVYEDRELFDTEQSLEAAGLHDRSQINVLCLPDRRVATADDAGQRVVFWNVDKGRRELTLDIEDEKEKEDDAQVSFSALRCGSVGIAPGLDFVVAVPLGPSLDGSGEYGVKIWAPDRGWRRLPLQDHQGSPWSILVSREGAMAITCTKEGVARLWCTRTGICLSILDGFNRLIPTASLQGSKAIAAATRSRNGRVVHLWGGGAANVEEIQQPIVTLDEHRTPVIVVASAGQQLATCTQHGLATLWNLTTASKVRTFEGKAFAQITCVAFSPCGDLLATGNSHGVGQLWNIASGEVKLTFESSRDDNGSRDEVRCIAFSPDGLLIALGFVWGPTRIWNLEHGRCTELVQMDCGDGVIVFEDREAK